MRKQLLFCLLLISSLLFVSCNKTNKAKSQDKTIDKGCDGVHWTHHKGEDGPSKWLDLCSGYSACGGKSQSPIDIRVSNMIEKNSLMAIQFDYDKSNVDVINNGHTVQFNISDTNSLSLDAKNYKLLQFHYHALSEHTLNGEHFPLEVHFVHRHSDSDYAVLSVMIVEGKGNALFTKYLSSFPHEKGVFKSIDKIDLKSLLPDDKSYFNYSGSLTTPPCTEVVNWYVLRNPISASREQISTFSKILHENYRPVQPINERNINVFNE